MLLKKMIVAGAAVAAIAAAGVASAADKDWRFGDGVTDERWSLISSEYALCDAGLMQSPVDLAQSRAVGKVELATKYGAAAGKIKLGTEKVQVDVAKGLSIVSGGQPFDLLQFHFHTPAEHAIGGQRDPLEVHFVHANAAGKLAVLGVMLREGPTNSALQPVIDAMAKGDGTAVTVNAAALVPSDLKVYRYMGSLTTPPCSEGVNWHVANQPMMASAAQIGALRAALGPSARSIQPLGERLLVTPSK